MPSKDQIQIQCTLIPDLGCVGEKINSLTQKNTGCTEDRMFSHPPLPDLSFPHFFLVPAHQP
jgi:hypothetical protein